MNNTKQWVQESGDNVCGVAAAMAEVEAKRLVPVRTGALQRSIKSTKIEIGKWKVSSDLHYAGFVEFGTSKMVAQPYLRPAQQLVSFRLNRALYEVLREKAHRMM